jgi:thiamine-phosphate pyrophosphorylase
MDRSNKIKDRRLYLVLTGEWGNGRTSLSIARQAVEGGIDILQMREKHMPRPALMSLGVDLAGLCRQNGVLFIVNDDPRLAVDLDADGVHMGKEDLAGCGVDTVRRIVGPHRIIGVSTHNPDQFRDALARDVDYLAFGPIFPTRTKDYHIGTEDIARVLAVASKPVFFIGGIRRSNLDILIGKGATNVALIRDIMEAEDVAERVRWYKRKLAGHFIVSTTTYRNNCHSRGGGNPL